MMFLQYYSTQRVWITGARWSTYEFWFQDCWGPSTSTPQGGFLRFDPLKSKKRRRYKILILWLRVVHKRQLVASLPVCGTCQLILSDSVTKIYGIGREVPVLLIYVYKIIVWSRKFSLKFECCFHSFFMSVKGIWEWG